MDNREAVNWLINISADIGKAEHSDLWYYEQALTEIKDMLESAQFEERKESLCKKVRALCEESKIEFFFVGGGESTWSVTNDKHIKKIVECHKAQLSQEDTTKDATSDTISRQAAIDALAKFVPYAICDESTESYTNGLTDAYNLICQLPSAQPEIIHCKECKFYTEMRQDLNTGICSLACQHLGGDGFCSEAERRTNE